MAVWFSFKDRVPRHSGYFVGWMCISYGPVRFLMDSFRHIETDTRYFGMTPAQYFSVAVTLLGLWVLYSRRNLAPPHGKWKREEGVA
jgi:prolipoprotein diacylglyceryltransferase